MGFKPILRVQIKDQNAKSKDAESRRAGMELRDGVHGTPYDAQILNANIEIRDKFKEPKSRSPKRGLHFFVLFVSFVVGNS